MGFAVAEAAAKKGYETILVAGPVALKTPSGVKRIDVVSAREMFAAADSAVNESGEDVIFIATAAVADFRPKSMAEKKLKKGEMTTTLELVKNPDILKSLKKKEGRLVKVGFAAETNDVLKEAARKCREKKLAFIVANDVTKAGAGFGKDTNIATLLFADGSSEALPLMTKKRLACKIVSKAVSAF